MPFISKDWRSPGEEWVKTQEGWEKKKILECGRQIFGSPQENTMDSSCSGMSEFASDQLTFSRMSPQWEDDEDKENISCNDNSTTNKNSLDGSFQPHCHITIKCTREIAGFNGLSDALKRLDFRSAVHDVRRFNYIMKLLDLLISNKLSTLSGCARKQLFHMLEEVAHQVSASQQNIHLLHRLLEQLRTTVECACWGRPLGSTLLWEQHLRTIDRILHIASHIQITEPGEGQFPKLEHLPEACAREIVLRLADHRDLESSALAWPGIRQVVEERRVWRELVQFHFSPRQIEFVLAQAQSDGAVTDPPAPVEDVPVDWQAVYHKLRKSFGLREDYAEMIQLCRNCRCLFWKSFGHPCIADQDPEFQEKLENVDKSSLHVPIPPHAFLKFFSL